MKGIEHFKDWYPHAVSSGGYLAAYHGKVIRVPEDILKGIKSKEDAIAYLERQKRKLEE